MNLRTLIVDDEPLAIARLRDLLKKDPEIEVIGECSNGRDAVRMIREESPDLVFLDVQMPELDGFGVLSTIGVDKMPAVVFVTAYDKFALKAFEVNAVDYLLKPFDRDRFKTALQRAKEHVRRTAPEELGGRISALLNDLGHQPQVMERLAIRLDGRILLVKIDDIDWVEAADNYINLHVGKESHLMRETMTTLEAKLPAKKFVRISRSTIVNVERIKEMQPLFHGEYVVILRDGTRLTLSRSHRDKLKQLGVM